MRQIKNKMDSLSKFHEENVIRLTRIEEKLIHLDECLDELKKDTLINLEKRVTALEKFVWRAAGAFAVIISLINLYIATKIKP